MANDKDKGIDFGEVDIDSLDFGDVGEDFDPFGQTQSGDSRTPIEEFKASVKAGVKERMMDPGLLRRLVGQVLPKGYSHAFNAYDGLVGSLNKVYSDNQSELSTYAQKLKTKIDRASPGMKRFIPKGLTDKLNGKSEDFGSFADGAPTEDALTANLAGLQALFQDQAQERTAQLVKEAANAMTDKKRFEVEIASSLAIGKGIGRLVGYQDTILVNYHRKSLELGYRQLDVMSKILASNLKYQTGSAEALSAIVKNTGLPDFVKMRSTEVVAQQMRQRMADTVLGSVGRWSKDYFKNLTQNASDMVGGALQFKSALDMGADGGMSRAGMAGAMAGKLVVDQASPYIDAGLDQLTALIAPLVSKIPGVQAGGRGIQNLLTGVPQRMNEWAKGKTQNEGILGILEENVKALLDRQSANTSIGENNLEDLDKPAYLDKLFHKTVVEIIPAYLSKQEKWLAQIATGEVQEEKTWSHQKDELLGRKSVAQANVETLIVQGSRGMTRNRLNSMLKSMGADELTEQATAALRKQLTIDMMQGNDFKPERYVKTETWRGVPEEVAEELIEHFAMTFGLDISGRQVVNDERIGTTYTDVRSQFLDLANTMPGYGERLGIMKGVTGRRAWREAGLTKFDGLKNDFIDIAALADLIANSEGNSANYGNTDENGNPRPIDLTRGPRGPRPGPGGGGAGPGDLGVGPSVSATITEWPELLKVADEKSHGYLEMLIQQSAEQIQFLQAIASMEGGEGGGGDGGGGGGRETRFGSWGRGLGRGAWKTLKGFGTGMSWYMKKAFKLQGSIIKGAGKLAWGAAKLPFGKGWGIKDVYVVGQNEPSLLAKKIRLGQYYDVNSNKVIKTLKDITGAVKDINGDVVLSQEEFDQGLMTGEGDSLAMYVGRGVGKVGGMFARGMGAYIGGTYGLMGRALKGMFNLAVDQFTQFDAYLPGDEEPRIRSNLLKKGHYRTKEGQPIFKLTDIKGAVFDIHGNEVVSEEEMDRYKSFYTRNGSLLYTVGRGMASAGRRIGGLAMSAGKAYLKLVGKMYGGLWKGAKAVGRGIRGGIGKLFGFKDKGGSASGGGMETLDEGLFEVNLEQLKTQVSIYQLLRESMAPKGGGLFDFDKDGDRDNSWADIVERRRKAKEGKGEKGDAINASGAIVAAIDKLAKQMKANFADLGDQVEEAGEDSLLDMAADADDLMDMGGDGDGKRRRGGRGGRRGGGRMGRFAKFKNWMGKTRVGSAAGRMAGAAGRMLGSTAGTIGLRALPFAGALGGLGAGAASAAGSLAAGAGAVLGGIGSAIAGVLSAPVLLGAAVVGGAAYIGYRYYKSSKAKEFPLLYLRMTQYGVDPTNQDRVMQVLALEKILTPLIQGKPGSLSINSNQVDVPKVMEIFGAKGDQERETGLLYWISRRFRPVFLAHAGGMFKVTGAYSLESADKGINDAALEGFLEDVNLPGMKEIYDDDEISPFDGDLDTDADDVDDAIKMVRERREKATKDREALPSGAALAAGRRGMTMTSEKGEMSKWADRQKIGVSPSGSGDAQAIKQGLILAATASGSAVAKQKAGLTTNSRPTLNVPAAVRYKTYGLKEFILDKVTVLQKIEELCWPLLAFDGTQEATLTGNLEEIENQICDIIKPPHEAAKIQVLNWIRNRFLPTFLQYCISCRRRYNGPVQLADKHMTGQSMYEVLTETSETQAETPEGKKSVWAVLNSPWMDEPVETEAGSVKIYIDSLDRGDKGGPLTVEGLKAQDRSSSENAKFQNRMTNIALGNTRDANTNVMSGGSVLGNMSKIYGSGQVAGGVAGQSTTGQGDGSLLRTPISAMGDAVQHPGGGTDGDINAIPVPKGDGWENVAETIIAAAKMQGFDPKIAASVAAIESSFRVKVGAGTSSAKGLYQFIDDTWASMMTKYGKKFGIAPGTTQYDGRANAILGVRYLIDNYNYLKARIPGEVTDTSLYAAHFMGPEGASKLLSGNPDSPATTITSAKVIRANPGIFREAGGKGRIRTVREVVAELDRRMKRARGMHTLGSDAGATETAVVNAPTGMSPASASDPGPETPSVPTMLAPMAPEGSAAGKGPVEGFSGGGESTVTAAPSLSDITSRATAAAGIGATNPSGQAEVSPTAAPEAIPAVLAAPTPTPTPTTVAAAAAQRTTAAEVSANAPITDQLLSQQLTHLGSIDATLKQIHAQVQVLAMAEPGARPISPMVTGSGPVGSTPATAPKTRAPVDNARRNAVT